jgi:hypothetical protein
MYPTLLMVDMTIVITVAVCFMKNERRLSNMETVYVLNYNDEGPAYVFLTKEAAKAHLWKTYCEECVPMMEPEKKDEWMEEDRWTFEEKDYIIDFGWVSEVVLVKE